MLPVADLGATVGQLGVTAILAAGIGAYAASQRDKHAAEREWLRSSLEAFYAPVTAKLEKQRLWSVGVLKEEKDRRAQHLETVERLKVQYKDLDSAALKKVLSGHEGAHSRVAQGMRTEWMKANVANRREVAILIEENLHYVDDPLLREKALAYLNDAALTDWHMSATLVDERDESSFILVSPEEAETVAHREGFHAAVTEEFERRAIRFRQLSRRASPIAMWRDR